MFFKSARIGCTLLVGVSVTHAGLFFNKEKQAKEPQNKNDNTKALESFMGMHPHITMSK